MLVPIIAVPGHCIHFTCIDLNRKHTLTKFEMKQEGWNQRLEGLEKKVEVCMLKAVENDTKERIKMLEKYMKRDFDKMKRHIEKTESEMKKKKHYHNRNCQRFKIKLEMKLTV